MHASYQHQLKENVQNLLRERQAMADDDAHIKRGLSQGSSCEGPTGKRTEDSTTVQAEGEEDAASSGSIGDVYSDDADIFNQQAANAE